MTVVIVIFEIHPIDPLDNRFHASRPCLKGPRARNLYALWLLGNYQVQWPAFNGNLRSLARSAQEVMVYARYQRVRQLVFSAALPADLPLNFNENSSTAQCWEISEVWSVIDKPLGG